MNWSNIFVFTLQKTWVPEILMGDEIKLYYMLDLYLPVFMFIADEPYPYPCEFDIFIKKNKKHMTR